MNKTTKLLFLMFAVFVAFSVSAYAQKVVPVKLKRAAPAHQFPGGSAITNVPYITKGQKIDAAAVIMSESVVPLAANLTDNEGQILGISVK